LTLAFALQLKKKHGKTSTRVRKTSARGDLENGIPENKTING
jgi:hypothetical protein